MVLQQMPPMSIGHLAETISTKCLKHFVRMICAIFECEYLWQPLRANLEKQLRINGDYNFLGMFVFCWIVCTTDGKIAPLLGGVYS
jgi:hypothetical protein